MSNQFQKACEHKGLERASEYMGQCNEALATAAGAVRTLQKAFLDAHRACKNANAYISDADSERLENVLEEYMKFDIFELQNLSNVLNRIRLDASCYGENLQKELDAETQG